MKKNANLLATFQKQKSLLGGGEKQQKRTLIIALTLIELLLIIGAYISYNNKNLDKYIFGSSTSSSDLFAVMIEDSNGNYQESTNSTFPGYEYFYNQTKSGCMSSNGKPIEDSLLYDQDKKKATVKVSETSMCYLYFDKYKSTTFADQLIDSGNLWQSNLEGDGYRYTGSGAVGTSTNPNNFICFGTTNKSACTANQDKYMYRVLGVFADANGKNHVKLIKYKQLEKYAWNANYKTDISWENSDMYKGLNGSYFLTNTTYDYLQNTTWSNKIENWTWSAVNTKTYDGSNGPNYYSGLTPSQIYSHEMNRTGKMSTVGEWTTPSAKIGSMYASDYTLSLGSSALAITGSTDANRATLKTGWMHQSNNDTTKNTWEWTLSRRGVISGNFYAWNVGSDGHVDYSNVGAAGAVRPVFYLTSNQAFFGGNGSLDNPFMIDISSSSAKLAVSTSATGSTLTAKITKGTGNLNKYCINNKASINDCEWKNITSTTITYNMSNDGTYYVHVIDDAGYIAHSSYTYKAWDSNLTLAENLIKYRSLWQSGLEGDGYRYTGSGAVGTDTNPNNFICFGTTDKTECTANQDKYMYRVLGVFSDANGNKHVKLIKYQDLGNYLWNADENSSIILWEDSDLYKGLNGEYFLTNTTYIPNSSWSNKIDNWIWSVADTQTETSGGPNYNDITTDEIYLYEMNRNTKTYSIGSWDTAIAKIGLMYISDYLLSLGSESLNVSPGDPILNESWLQRYNMCYIYTGCKNVNNAEQWTFSRNTNDDYLQVWYISDNKFSIDKSNYLHGFGAIPTFYLTSDVTSSGGTGTVEDPIMLN